MIFASFCLVVAALPVAAAVAPLSTSDPADLGFFTASRSGDALPSSTLWAADLAATARLPTNEWWENAAVGTGGLDANLVFALPYAWLATENGVKVMTPFTQYVNNIWEAEVDSVVAPVYLGSTTSSAYTVCNSSDLGVTLCWADAGYTAPLVQGSPWVTAFYDGMAQPQVSSAQMSSQFAVDGQSITCNSSNGTGFGHTFSVSFTQSDSTWTMYASQAVEWDCSSTTSSEFEVTLDSSFSGFVRVAMVNNCTFGSNPHGDCTTAGYPDNHDDYAATLLAAAGTVPTGGDVSVDTSDGVTVTLSWSLSTSTDWASSPLLMAALPHHIAALEQLVDEGAVLMEQGHRTVRGWMPLVTANEWPLQLQHPEPAFTAPRSIGDDFTESLLDALLSGDAPDANYTLPDNYQIGAGDPYYAGKMLAKMAQIAVVADELGESAVRADLIDKLKNYSAVWLESTSLNSLVYDVSWGGLVSCGCTYDAGECDNTFPDCPAMTDSGMDFGNAFYNDHHFHYGYHLYAHAVIAHFDAEWALAHMEQSLVMIRDIANPSNEDPFFPASRYMDWFAGHSWASGVGDPTSLGKNQESSSEAFNAWYGMALWGQALKDVDSSGVAARVESLGTALMALEAAGAQTYWHTMIGSDIYPSDFAELHCVGILWSGSAQYQTWFGSAPYYIHGIQMLPFTPASEFLLNADWLEEETPVYSASCDDTCASQGWSTPLALATSVNDQQAGWALAQALTDDMFANGNAGGNGNSRTTAYYFVATRQ